ncbi:MAG: histidine kinase [Chitinophagales bacterium]|nr:histidine kinase [Chitinophagales bacterium]
MTIHIFILTATQLPDLVSIWKNLSHEKKYWCVQIIFWTLYNGYLNINIWRYSSFEVGLIELISFNTISILGSHIYRNTLRKLKINYSSLVSVIGYALIGTVALSAVIALMSILFYYYLEEPNGEPLHFFDYLSYFSINCSIVSIWFFSYHTYKFAQSLGRTEAEKARIEQEKAEADALLKSAELDSLKSQLNPHFLFNALNSIKALTLENPHGAREAITQLSDLLRTSLNFHSRQLISLKDELALVNDYLCLEKIRFEERLECDLLIDPDALDVAVPPMILQMLTENAIKHGISQHEQGGTITIRGTKTKNQLKLCVENKGNFDFEVASGIGFRNLARRLKLNYGEGASFNIHSENQVVKATVIIPLL